MEDRMGLRELLEEDINARNYYNTLHPVVRHKVRQQADSIGSAGDLYAIANNEMTNALIDINEIYQDSDPYPFGSDVPQTKK
ncbi:MAG: hypothetical protein BWY11_00455 [Firmicutes bacterium ADurb.Bin182]|nr:MAG: hypothetical protein BWY11_00455 [Firmicutes bacterium ADurb.Bin182]